MNSSTRDDRRELAPYAKDITAATRTLAHTALRLDTWSVEDMADTLEELKAAASYIPHVLMALRMALDKPTEDNPPWLTPAVLDECTRNLQQAEGHSRNCGLSVTWAKDALSEPPR